MVCHKSDRVPMEVTAGKQTVAVRIPAHPVAIKLLSVCDFPIAAPSANRSKYISPTRPEHLLGPSGIADHLSLVLDGGPCCWGLESTIVMLGHNRSCFDLERSPSMSWQNALASVLSRCWARMRINLR